MLHRALLLRFFFWKCFVDPWFCTFPDILWGPDYPRDKYTAVFRNLATNAELGLCSRISALLAGCNTGVLFPEARKRRQVICYKAVWAITALIPGSQSSLIFVRSLPDSHDYIADHEVSQVAVSTRALVEWTSFRADTVLLQEHLRSLQSTDCVEVDEKKLTGVSNCIKELLSKRAYTPEMELDHNLTVDELIEIIQCLLIESPYRILFNYILSVSTESHRRADSLPYSFHRTSKLILPSPRSVPVHIQEELNQTLDRFVSTVLEEHDTSDVVHLDTLISELMTCWSPSCATTIPISLVRYITNRASGDALAMLMFSIPDVHQIGDLISQTLLNETSDAAQNQLLQAIWRLCYFFGVLRGSCLILLHLVRSLGMSSMFASLRALLQWQWVDGLGRGAAPLAVSEFLARFEDSLLPVDTAIILDPDDGNEENAYRWKLSDRIAEAKISIVAEFLEACTGGGLFPYKAKETLRRIIGAVQDHRNYYEFPFAYYPMAVHDTHQGRLSNAIREAFCSPRCTELRSAIIHHMIFDLYYEGFRLQPPERFGEAWLTNGAARETIKTAFLGYADELAASADQDLTTSRDLERIRAILQGLDSLHATADDTL
ncbi:hypothetical protein DFH06DRAFT_1147127 [Mycena polygramma]|nr:hypothetical protein DFH06DRAFT_1147127 [Mycena polygramma]